MIITNKLSMDLLRPGLYQVIHAVQGEAYTRRLEISLYAGGVAWEIPDDVTVSVRYRKMTVPRATMIRCRTAQLLLVLRATFCSSRWHLRC